MQAPQVSRSPNLLTESYNERSCLVMIDTSEHNLLSGLPASDFLVIFIFSSTKEFLHIEHLASGPYPIPGPNMS
jgi:hypothetical protein